MPDEAITALLHDAEREGRGVVDRLVPLVYEELRGVAHRLLAREHGPRTLSTTAVVHEAYLKLVGGDDIARRGRAYFFGAAARAMRQVLVEAARRRRREKRGGDHQPLSLTNVELPSAAFVKDVVAVDEALDRLATVHPRPAQVIECRFFGGLSEEETASTLEVSVRTVRRDWAFAQAWLFRELRPAP